MWLWHKRGAQGKFFPGGWLMRYVQGKIRTLLAQQSGQIQLLIIAPILTLSFLSLVVRTANSAIDPSLEKKKVNQQLKQRLLEVRGTDPKRLADPEARVSDETQPARTGQETEKGSQSTHQIWQVAEFSQIAQLTPSLTPPVAVVEEKKLSPQQPIPNPTNGWTLAQRNFLGGMSLVHDSTTKKIENASPQIQIHTAGDVKKVLVATQSQKKSTSAPVITAALTPIPLPAPAPVKKEETLLPPPAHVVHTIKKQETLEKIFKQIGVSSQEAAEWLKVAKKEDVFRNLRPKRTIELNFVEETATLKSLVYEIEAETRVILERKAKNKIHARREEPPTQQVLFVIGGKIETSLAKSLRKAGLPARIVDDVAELEWDVDLSDLRKGDTFKVLVEAVQKGEQIVTYKNLLAAEVNHRQDTYAAFSIPEERLLRRKKAEVRYKGEGLSIESEGEQFLRFPLEFTRVSSVFTDSRMHPILGRARPHTGVDFAAPRGTPVRSVASGTVTFLGHQSGYGKLIKVDHPGPYETAYAHLQEYADDIFEGAAVERGQVIGYVGSTGLATGPHLHFELYKDGVFVNPLGESAVEIASVIEEKEEKEAVVDPVIAEKKKQLSEQLAALAIKGKQRTSLIIPLQETLNATDVAVKEVNRREAATRSSRQGRLR